MGDLKMASIELLKQISKRLLSIIEDLEELYAFEVDGYILTELRDIRKDIEQVIEHLKAI